MKILASYGKDELATVWIAQFDRGRVIEFAESVQPPVPRSEKWVLLISTSVGCPVGCPICDAGTDYQGLLTRQEMFEQIDFLVEQRYTAFKVPVPKFKIQFARMGEPAFNRSVLEVLEEMPKRYEAPGVMPCVSTIAPEGSEVFFEALLEIKKAIYGNSFQLQFSVHTTDIGLRDQLIPARKWEFDQIAEYGKRFYEKGNRKIGLNFATPSDFPIAVETINRYFNPAIFFLKFTPVNPTYQAMKNRLNTYIDPYRQDKGYPEIDQLKEIGYDVLISIGENEENLIGSNCGQYITSYLKSKIFIKNSYQLDNYLVSKCPG